MTIEQPAASSASSLIERAKNILLTPQTEFAKIAVETTPLASLLTGYVLPLALIGAIASVIGGFLSMSAFGGLFGGFALIPAVIGIILQVAYAVLGCFLMGLLINALATTFGSQPNPMRANQLAVYSATGGLVGGFGTIIPFVGGLIAIAGAIYSIFLLYIGLPRLMGTPEDKRVAYTAVVVVIAVVAGFIISSLVAAVMMFTGFGLLGGAAAIGAAQQRQSGIESVEIGGANVNIGDLERAANQLEQAYANGEAGGAPAIDPARLQALLPDSLPGGFTRTATSSGSAGAMAAGASTAEAEYTRGDARISVDVVHLGGLGGLAAMAGAMNVQSNSETADGYERIRTVDGRTITESVNRASNSATYGVIGRNGAAVTAEGTGVSIEELRAAVDAVGVGRVEGLGGA